MNAMSEAHQVIITREVPVDVAVAFYFARPASKRKRATMTVRPDADKLARAFLDSITGIIIQDDSQVTDLRVAKRYGIPERTEVTVNVIDNQE
jgi:Holliday junction resolvase RusA-like endonuclease